MGQIQSPAPPPSIILTAVDRLQASNAGGGVNPNAEHLIFLGEDAGENLGDLDGVIGLGAFSLDAGLADVQLAGTIAIGIRAASALTAGTVNNDATSDCVVIGQDAAAAAQFLSGCVIIGGEALKLHPGSQNLAGPERSVVIGNEACERLAGVTQFTSNVVIGWRSLRGAVGNAQSYNSNVLIGDQIANGAVAALTGNVVVGSNAGSVMGSGGNAPTQNTVVGQGAAGGLDSGDTNVIVGSAAGPTALGAGEQSDSVILGASATAYGSKYVCIGRAAGPQSFGAVGARSIIIGYQAGITLGGGTTDLFIVETFDGGANNGMLYGDMAKGVLIVGRSNTGVDRDTGGAGSLNLFKVINGNVGAAGPVGGYFHLSIAGEAAIQTAIGGVARTYNVTPYQVIGEFLVAALPAGVQKGNRAFVTDALAPVFAAAPAGGGAIYAPVYYDGAAWLLG